MGSFCFPFMVALNNIDAYDDDDHPWESVKEIIDQDVKLNKEEKKVLEEDLTILGEFASLFFFPQVSGHAPFTDTRENKKREKD